MLNHEDYTPAQEDLSQGISSIDHRPLPKGNPGNRSALVQMSSPGHMGDTLHKVPRMPGNVWLGIDGEVDDAANPISNKTEGNSEDALNLLQAPPCDVSGTPNSISRRALLFSVAGYPTWEDPLPSQKKHLWSVTFKN